MQAPQILLTNDDGVHSPGLLAAATVLNALAPLQVIAPLHQQTAMGRAQRGNKQATLTHTPLQLGHTCIDALACDASPALAVAHGLSVLHTFTPRLLVSGINYGENLGSSITCSGTVGAALEGACRGIPSIAVSMETGIDAHFNYLEQDWSTAAHFLRQFAAIVLERGLPPDVHVLKIDVPASATPETPWRLTTVSPNSYYHVHLEAPSLDSRLGDARMSKGPRGHEHPHTDVYALSIDKVVSVTPLTFDLTSRAPFAAIHTWLTN